jgi:S-DNA-T family DNA segregation ATPase FtsK/SpoIIIE
MIGTILKWTTNLLFSILGAVIVWCAKGLGIAGFHLGRQIITHPRTSLAAGTIGAAVYGIGWETVLLILGLTILAGSIWKAAHAATFERLIMGFLRTWMARWWTYSRVWNKVMTRCGLVVEVDKERHIPQLKKVSTDSYWDRLVVQLQVGQEIGDYESAGGRLRAAFTADRISVTEVEPNRVGIALMRRDPLVHEKVAATPIPDSVEEIDFTALRIGLTEHVEPFTVSVLGGHTAISGATNSGKAGVVWNILRALAPAIAAGIVRPVGIDPKAMELRQARSLFAEDDYAVTAEDVLTLLQKLVEEMDAVKAAKGAAGERNHEPTTATPLVLICIDELAPLLAYWSRSIRDQIDKLLGLLLTQGRAAGFIVIGAIQEPTKDIFKCRDLFARKIALRLPTASHTDAALTEDAGDRGAVCHRIPESLPGVLFTLLDGQPVATRARLGHVTDDDIAELVEHVTNLRNVVDLDSRRTAAVENKEVAA